MLGMFLGRHNVEAAAAEVGGEHSRVVERLLCQEGLGFALVLVGHDALCRWPQEAGRRDKVVEEELCERTVSVGVLPRNTNTLTVP